MQPRRDLKKPKAAPGWYSLRKRPNWRATRLAGLHSGARWQPFQTQLGF